MRNRLFLVVITLFIVLPFMTCSLPPNSLEDLQDDPQQERLIESVKMPPGKIRIQDVKFSPDGTCLAVAGSFGILLYDTQTYDKPNLLTYDKPNLLRLEGHTGEICSIAFRPDGKTLAGACQDGTVRLWDVNTRQQIRTFGINVHPMSNITFSPDGKMIASASGRIDGVGNAYLWDADTGKCLRTFPVNTKGIVYDVTFSPDGNMLASSSDEPIISLWNVNTGKQIRTLTTHTGPIFSVVFSPDGRMLANRGPMENVISLWNVKTGQQIRTLRINAYPFVEDVAFSPDGKTIASVSGCIHLWNANTGQQIRTLFNGKYPSTAKDVAFSPDGKTISCTGFHEAHVWDVETGKLIRLLISNPKVKPNQ
ncbi:MAG: WD40 repeat domain-containing protein [Candidatus Poribacteria bacterium]|nr:WD40 repeat domain-containing protein [Candidatus Poribacteria bacterium]